MTTNPEEAIRNAMAIYAHAVDDRDYSRLEAIFDGETVYVLTSRTCHGVNEAVDALGAALSDHPRDRHLVTNVRIEVDGKAARASSDWYLVAPTDGAWEIVAAGRYRDELEYKDHRWVFSRREIELAPRD